MLSFLTHQDSVIHVFTHTCACPDKAAHMYFGHVAPKPVLGMTEFPQIVHTMIGQVICKDFLHFPAFTGFAKTQSNNYRNFSHWKRTDKDCLVVRCLFLPFVDCT